MESKLVLYDNYRKNNGSFTYYLEARETFNSFAFGSLCESIRRLSETAPGNREVLLQVHHVYTDILKYFIARGSAESLSQVAGFPPGRRTFWMIWTRRSLSICKPAAAKKHGKGEKHGNNL